MPRSRTDRKKQPRPAPARKDSPTLPQGSDRIDFSNEAVRRRFICDLFQFWFGCRAGSCQRQRRCVGDPQACFDRFWWMVPERLKVEFRAYVKARVAGAPHDEASDAAEKEVVRQAQYIAEIDAAVDAQIAARRRAESAARHGE